MTTALWDLIAAAGLGLLAVGLWMAWPPLAPIVVGLLCILAGLWGARLTARERRRREVKQEE